MRLVWFRNDLRCHGHTPLTQALAGGDEVTALHILCPDQWDAHGVAPARRWFVLHSLLELGESLAAVRVGAREDKGIHTVDMAGFSGERESRAPGQQVCSVNVFVRATAGVDQPQQPRERVDVAVVGGDSKRER